MQIKACGFISNDIDDDAYGFPYHIAWPLCINKAPFVSDSLLCMLYTRTPLVCSTESRRQMPLVSCKTKRVAAGRCGWWPREDGDCCGHDQQVHQLEADEKLSLTKVIECRVGVVGLFLLEKTVGSIRTHLLVIDAVVVYFFFRTVTWHLSWWLCRNLCCICWCTTRHCLGRPQSVHTWQLGFTGENQRFLFNCDFYYSLSISSASTQCTNFCTIN